MNSREYIRHGLKRTLLASVFVLMAMAAANAGAAMAASSPFGGAPVVAVGKLSWQDGSNFCASQGRLLPTAAQLKDFAGKVADPAKYGAAAWFWTQDAAGEKYQAIAMGTGAEDAFAKNDALFAACVDDPARKNKGAPAPKEAIGASVAGFTTGMAAESANWENADLFCKSQGRHLPTVAQLQAVAGATGNGAYANYHWPTGMFWTREPGGQGHQLVHLGNGKAMWFPDKDRHWAVCSDE